MILSYTKRNCFISCIFIAKLEFLFFQELNCHHGFTLSWTKVDIFLVFYSKSNLIVKFNI